jgi:hypothetical protein
MQLLAREDKFISRNIRPIHTYKHRPKTRNRKAAALIAWLPVVAPARRSGARLCDGIQPEDAPVQSVLVSRVASIERCIFESCQRIPPTVVCIVSAIRGSDRPST